MVEVKSLYRLERKMDNRGTKCFVTPAPEWETIAKLKAQRVDGKKCFNKRHLRYTLMGYESSYQVKIPSKLNINKRFYSSIVKQSFSSKAGSFEDTTRLSLNP